MRKNQSFVRRAGFALAGIVAALRSENSFRAQMVAAVAVLLALVWLQPEPHWWAILLLTVAAVLAAELFNTAIEHLADHLHPDEHANIGLVKDCAAAAVFVLSVVAVAVAAAFVWHVLTR